MARIFFEGPFRKRERERKWTYDCKIGNMSKFIGLKNSNKIENLKFQAKIISSFIGIFMILLGIVLVASLAVLTKIFRPKPTCRY